MDILKWLLKMSLIIALLFIGLKTNPKDERTNNEQKDKKAAIVSLFF